MKNDTRKQNNHDHNEVSELLEDNEKTHPLVESIYNQTVKGASTHLGQFVLRKVDRLLWTIENTAKWSVPQNVSESSDGNSEKPLPPPPLVRPLPWILFIPALIAMRFTRAALSFILMMIFNRKALQPSTIVHYIQVRRRKLRAIKYQGLKAIRQRHTHNDHKSDKSLVQRLMRWGDRLMCKNSATEDGVKVVVAKKNKSSIEVQDNSNSSKRHHDDVDDSDDNVAEEKIKCAELLGKYADEDSDDDSNFEIDEETESGSDDEPSETEDAIDKKNETTNKQNGETNTNNQEVNFVQQNGHHHNGESQSPRMNGNPPDQITKEPLTDISTPERPVIVVTNTTPEV